MWLDISMGACGKKLKIFHCIDFEIIAFEGRRKCFFGRSVGFDLPLRQKHELHEVEFLQIHNVLFTHLMNKL
jgi:hypothetical protein